MKKKFIYIISILIIGLFLVSLIWSFDNGGNLNIYLQNEYGIVKDGSFDVKVLLNDKFLMSDSIYYDQTVPLSISQWEGFGSRTVTVRSKTLGVSCSKTFFLYSTTWMVFRIKKNDIEVIINRWPITLQ